MSNAFERSVIYQRRLILVIHQFSFLICGFLDSLTASETAKQGGISLTPLAENCHTDDGPVGVPSFGLPSSSSSYVSMRLTQEVREWVLAHRFKQLDSAPELDERRDS